MGWAFFLMAIYEGDKFMSFSKFINTAIAITLTSIATSSFAALVDTTGAQVTNETALGDIDMAASTMGDLSNYMATGIVADATNTLSTDIKYFVTNSTFIGYTSWEYTGDVEPNATYNINVGGSEGAYTFTLINTTASTQIGVVTTNILNPTVLVYTYNQGTITASREEIRRLENGLALFSNVQQLRTYVDTNDRALSNDVQNLRTYVDDMDTSYYNFSLINSTTGMNQSVQYVYTDAQTTQLEIKPPPRGMTKDWLVYINPAADLNLILPPGDYWSTSEDVTNAIPANQPTALYFSEITNNFYSLGRKEFQGIFTVLSTREIALLQKLEQIKDKKKARRKLFSTKKQEE